MNALVSVSLCIFQVALVVQQDSQEQAIDYGDPVVNCRKGGYLQPYFSKRSKTAEPRLRFQDFSDNLEVHLGNIRFLGYEQIQNELRVSPEQLRMLSSILEDLRKVESQIRFDYFSRCKEIKLEARQKLTAFSSASSSKALAEILTEQQFERLEQIQRRFCLLGWLGLRKKVTDWFEKSMKLTQRQRVKIIEIVEDEKLDFENLVQKKLDRILSEEQKAFVEKLADSEANFFSNSGLQIAQVSDFYNFDDEQPLSGTVVIIPTGQFCDLNQLLYRGSTYKSASQSQLLLMNILRGNMDWLELTDEQMEQIRSLRLVKEQGRGVPEHVGYVGWEALANVTQRMPSEDCTKEEFRAWEKDFRDATKTADRKLDENIKKVLLPFQIGYLDSSVAIARLPSVGILHGLDQEWLGEDLELNSDQRRNIKQLMNKLKSAAISKTKRIESRVGSVLTKKQNQFLEEKFGKCPEFYPSFWTECLKR